MKDDTVRRIAAQELIPVDRVAARVTRGGVHYEPNKKILTADSDLPILTTRNPKDVPDLTGTKFGHFTVLGWFLDGNGWVVKCVCGIYSIRKTRAVLNPRNNLDRCERCRHLLFLRRENHWRVHGRDISPEEL